ncbi:MAG: GNAT family N-acetyltransferase [Elusimicrobia bacterium]|nr:GNAT family N-acetyltransferase [Elusimicrobiota bacterium]
MNPLFGTGTNLMITFGDFKFVVATTPELLEGVFRLRYQVYVDEFGYEHAGDHPEGKEMDEWDPFSIHMAALNPEGDVVGTIRLVLNSTNGLPTLNVVVPFIKIRIPNRGTLEKCPDWRWRASFRRRVEDGFQGVGVSLAQVKHCFPQPEKGIPSQERRKRFCCGLGAI